MTALSRFATDDAGGFTVDWVLVAAAGVALALAAVAVAVGGVEAGSAELQTGLADLDPAADPFAANGDAAATAPLAN